MVNALFCAFLMFFLPVNEPCFACKIALFCVQIRLCLHKMLMRLCFYADNNAFKACFRVFVFSIS